MGTKAITRILEPRQLDIDILPSKTLSKTIETLVGKGVSPQQLDMLIQTIGEIYQSALKLRNMFRRYSYTYHGTQDSKLAGIKTVYMPSKVDIELDLYERGKGESTLLNIAFESHLNYLKMMIRHSRYIRQANTYIATAISNILKKQHISAVLLNNYTQPGSTNIKIGVEAVGTSLRNTTTYRYGYTEDMHGTYKKTVDIGVSPTLEYTARNIYDKLYIHRHRRRIDEQINCKVHLTNMTLYRDLYYTNPRIIDSILTLLQKPGSIYPTTRHSFEYILYTLYELVYSIRQIGRDLRYRVYRQRGHANLYDPWPEYIVMELFHGEKLVIRLGIAPLNHRDKSLLVNIQRRLTDELEDLVKTEQPINIKFAIRLMINKSRGMYHG